VKEGFFDVSLAQRREFSGGVEEATKMDLRAAFRVQ
jgi:hypothetical protein